MVSQSRVIESIALTCAVVALGSSYPPLASAAVSTAATAPADADENVARAKDLFAQGAAKYETADYAGAIDHWTEAYALVPAVPQYAEAKADLIFNIATAREKAFDVDGDIQQLNQAKILLEQYRSLLPDIYESTPEREFERSRVDEKIEVIDRKIKAADDKRRRDAKEGTLRAENRGAKNLIIAGAVVTSVGAAGLGVAAAGMAIGSGANDLDGVDPNDLDARRKQFDRGRTGNTLAIAGGVAAGVLVPVGVALITVGVLRKKKLDNEMALVPAPLVSPHTGGVALVGRF